MADHPGMADLLAEETEQINSYVRHSFQLLISWFTFFGTTNIVAIGWFASTLAGGGMKSVWPIWLVGVFFIIQSVLGSFACRYVYGHFRRAAQRLESVLRLLTPAGVDATAGAQPPTAPALYARITWLMISALVSFMVIWGALIMVAVVDFDHA